ncbi:hypothetical protein FBY30_1963 [Arthrobacter sp. SLBN-83]|nr:hypothetical protein FBY30_1963 [Arthrobacter sp. SLBN-83]
MLGQVPLGTTFPESYRGTMSIFVEAVGAVVQALAEVAAELLCWNREGKQRDDESASASQKKDPD